ncbi:patatin-like protein [Micromonospora sp. DR5-3]|uniref:patatin-like protein n=1 Tax=unclassified Micromonospora TaxID=2617518 RepID=UPI0011D868BD|nr:MULTISPECIES: patatin-like protein [unclassified Micromonospora]MCW3820444.1 patatin-like protein [Micromonospora sp. DR5-3]TYC20391.1 patatin-like protein [Micromonospora sp. MP36]
MAETVEDHEPDWPASPAEDADRQDIRLAAVMTGGVSLAVWISGVTLELFRLATARSGAGSAYSSLLDLLRADVRVDVISGTSAGGLNGAFLALGLARGGDLSVMRDLWHEHGSLDRLLRDPLTRNPKSLLKGDDYFLPKVREALEKVISDARRPPSCLDDDRLPIELVLTGTLWQGRSTTFTDDLGVAVTETDHDATFRFADLRAGYRDGRPVSGDLAADAVLEELAAAARCTSAFPGAFEPHFVWVSPGDPDGDLRWASTAGRANFRESQHVVDGGVLLNKPIRPALEAVYRQTAGVQVRRVLAYVAPDPGEQIRSSPTAHLVPEPDPANLPGSPLPSAREVLLGVLTRLRATDSVSRELTEIRNRNANVRVRRRARDRFAMAMTDVADQLSERAWPAYLEVRAENAARTLAPLLAAGQRGRPAEQWSMQELLAALRRQPMSFIPTGPLPEALGRVDASWDWGQTTVQRLADMTVDLLKRAVWLAHLGTPERRAIVCCRETVTATLKEIHADREDLNRYWSTAPTGPSRYGISPMPARRGSLNQTAENLPELERWLAAALVAWDCPPVSDEGARRARLYRQALELARRLREIAPALRAVSEVGNDVLDPDGEWTQRLAALHRFLVPPQPAQTTGRATPQTATADAGPAISEERIADETVLQNMLRLDVVQLAFTSASPEPEQEVELAKLSSLHPDRLTGIQLHHFGAFYRGSWRMNDWLHGRMDAVEQLIRILLAPERLRQCLLTPRSAAAAGPRPAPAQAVAQLMEAVERCAVPDQSPDRSWLAEQWAQDRAACEREVEQIIVGPDAPALRACTRVLARPIQTAVLREDLPSLANAVRAEGNDRSQTSNSWLESFDAADRNAGQNIPAPDLWRLWEEAAKIGRERIGGDVGSDTFARTLSHTATVLANVAGDSARIKPVAMVLSAFRGYALAVWAMVAMLTRGSAVGTHAVEIAVAAGGVLLAVTLLVPAVPIALTLLAVLLLLAGFSSAALLSPRTRPVGVRLAAAALVVLLTLAGILWWDWSRSGSAALVWSLSIKLGVSVLIVLLGWWVARAQPRQPGREPR